MKIDDMFELDGETYMVRKISGNDVILRKCSAQPAPVPVPVEVEIEEPEYEGDDEDEQDED